jgi:hypothetical protein
VNAATKPRTWTLTIPAPCDWLTANIERHRFKRSKLVREWRQATVIACRAAKLPHNVTPVVAYGVAFYTGRRPVRDRLNLAPTFKAIIDALTPHAVKWRAGKPIVSIGYGFLPDDSDAHVRSTTWELATAASVGRAGDGVVLRLAVVAEPADSHCHVVRDGDRVPCTARPAEPHVDASGREWGWLNDYADEATEGCG